MSFVQSVSFRARKLDETRPLMVVHDEAVLEAEGTPVVNRSVPDMPTGMEKEEEREAHFVRALQSHAVISIPTIATVAPVARADEAPWRQPSHLVVYAPPPDRRVMDENNTQAEYDLTESDTEFVRHFIDGNNGGSSGGSGSGSGSGSNAGQGAAKTKRRAGGKGNSGDSNSSKDSSNSSNETECAALCDLAEALIDRYERAGYQQQRAGRGALTREAAVRGAGALLAACARQHAQLGPGRLQQFARAVFDYWMAKRSARPRHGDFLQDKYRRVPEPGNLDPYTAFRARGDEWTGGSVVGSHARKRRRTTPSSAHASSSATGGAGSHAHSSGSGSGSSSNSGGGNSSGSGSSGSQSSESGTRHAGAERERVVRLRKLQDELARLRAVLSCVVQREQHKLALVSCAAAAPSVLATVDFFTAPPPTPSASPVSSSSLSTLAQTLGASQQARARQLLGCGSGSNSGNGNSGNNNAGSINTSSYNNSSNNNNRYGEEDVRDVSGEVGDEWQRVAFGAEREGDGSSSEDADAYAHDHVDAAEARRRRARLPAVAQHSCFAAARPVGGAGGTGAARTLSLTQQAVPLSWREWVARGHAYFARQDAVYGGAAYALPLRDPARQCAPYAQTALACSPGTDSDADDEGEGAFGEGCEGLPRVRRVRHGCCLRAQLGRGGRVAFDRRALEAWLQQERVQKRENDDDEDEEDDSAMTDAAVSVSVAATPLPPQTPV